jgi:hypothetical protein
MGIIGLETYFKSVENTLKRELVLAYVPLRRLRLVIDGNSLAHKICETFKNNCYGGNYDQIYSQVKSLLIKLRPFTHAVIFAGGKSNSEKPYDRLVDNIKRILAAQLDIFQCFQPLFMRTVIFEVLKELNITFFECKAENNFDLFCYANGSNETNEKFTVLTKNSFFYIYDLKEGYLNFDHISSDFNLINDSTKLPIFYVSKLLNFFRIKHISWVYACILNGVYNTDLRKNLRFFRLKGIDRKLENLVSYFLQNEERLVSTNFSEIRNTYDGDCIQTLTNLVERLESTNTQLESKFEQPFAGNEINDFDSIILTIKYLNKNFVQCLIQDMDEQSVFQIVKSNNIAHMVYYNLSIFYEFGAVREIDRDPNSAMENLKVKDELIKVYHVQNNLIYDYLSDQNLVLDSNENYHTLFLVSLSVWSKWLSQNEYKNAVTYSAESFVDSLLTNFIIITLKNYGLQTGFETLTNSLQLASVLSDYTTNEREKRIVCLIVEYYQEFLTLHSTSVKKDEYFREELRIVHRINEFQILYYWIGLLSKTSQFKYQFLSPNQFLNSLFVCKFLKMETDQLRRIKSLITLSSTFQELKKVVLEKFKRAREGIYEIKPLSDLLKTIKLS